MDEAKIIELEKRVSLLEGWKEGHGEVLESIRRDMDDLKTRVTFLEQKVDRKFAEMDKKIFALDQKMTRFFMWVIGIQFGIFITIILMLLRQ